MVFRNDATRPEVSSDHDGIVGYLNVPAAAIGQAKASVTAALSKQADGSFLLAVTVTNSGTATAQAVQVTSAVLGSTTTTTALPLQFGDIAVNGSKTLSLSFPASSGVSGARSSEQVSGTYSTGSFSLGQRVVLP